MIAHFVIADSNKEQTEMDLIHISAEAALIIVVLGMAVVFAGLIMLMFVVRMMSAILNRKKAEAAEADAEAEDLRNTEAVRPAEAPGTAGELKLYNTDPKDAAMVMAIVADSLGKPLNELRFNSIREIGGQNGDGKTDD